MEKPIFDPDEWIVSFNDVKQLYISIWKKLLKWALLGAVTALIVFGNRTPKFKAEASFKEGVERTNSETIFKEFMIGFGSGHQPQASTYMKSFQVLRPIVEKMGLQVVPISRDWKLKRLIKRFRENFRAEKGLLLEEMDPFVFENTRFEEEQSFLFKLAFSDPEHFSVYDDQKKEIGKGSLGQVVYLQNPSIQFSLKKSPADLKMNVYYPFLMMNWASAVGSLRAQLKIETDKDNPSLLNISVLDRDRHLAARLVNELMNEYQRYLKREYDHVSKAQIAYLENKQDQVYEKMDGLFNQHTAYLTENLEKNGIIGLDQETHALLLPHQQMQSKVMGIDVELGRLSELEKEGRAVALAEEGPFAHNINQITQRIQDLKQQRDLLELSFNHSDLPSYDVRNEELREIRNQRCALEKLVDEVDHEQEITSLDLDRGLFLWAQEVRAPEEKEDFVEYLENYSRLLSLREKMLQERLFYGNPTPPELEGMDLASARNLFMEYNGKLDSVVATIRKFEQFKAEIQREDFEIGSLGSVLPDPLCQKIIGEVGFMEQQLKDENHHSLKEEEKWHKEIGFQRKVLSDHIDHLIQVEELNAELIRNKMSGLQRLSLDCINQQISVLHEQANDGIKQRRAALLLEKSLLEKKMEELRLSLAKVLPEKWRFEKWLSIKMSMMNKIMETVTEGVESKTISAHLHQVESKPLDYALIPMAPQPPRLYKMMWLGAFAASMLAFSWAFVKKLLKGFPTSLEKLYALKLPVLGSISTLCDGPSVETPTGSDLELLRKISLFMEGGKVIGLIGGQGPDYSYALSENLARRSSRSIVLRCDFHANFRSEDSPGLLQIWKGEIGELPIRKQKGFDLITSGGFSPFGTEIIQSQSFSQLVEILKKNYDWVFLLFRSPLSSAESSSALRLCDRAIVTISGEQPRELTPFVDWAYHQNSCRLTFIART